MVAGGAKHAVGGGKRAAIARGIAGIAVMGGDVAEVAAGTGLIAFIVSMEKEIESRILMPTGQAIGSIITTSFTLCITRITYV